VHEAETFAERFSRLIKERGLTDTEVASLLGVSEGAVRKIKRGDTQSLKLHGALRLAKRLSVTPYYLAGEREPRARTRSRGAAAQATPPEALAVAAVEDLAAKLEQVDRRLNARIEHLEAEVLRLRGRRRTGSG